jgi:hypothetical protein
MTLDKRKLLTLQCIAADAQECTLSVLELFSCLLHADQQHCCHDADALISHSTGTGVFAGVGYLPLAVLA